jgi:hypothetical protein
MKIFLFGDSFAANNKGWPSMLGVDVSNFAENGIGEYKIYKKVLSENDFDKCIICHTSPWRVHTRFHPIHSRSEDRPNNDFLLNDVEYHSKDNKQMQLVNQYLQRYYDPDYQFDVYKLMLDKMMEIKNAIHLTFHDLESKINNNYYHIWKKHPGDINHMSIQGNQIVAEIVKQLI